MRRSELFFECRKFSYAHVFGASEVVAPLKFHQELWYRKIRVPNIRRCLRENMFSLLNRTQTCDERTDGRTQDHSMCRAIVALRGKNLALLIQEILPPCMDEKE